MTKIYDFHIAKMQRDYFLSVHTSNDIAIAQNYQHMNVCKAKIKEYEATIKILEKDQIRVRKHLGVK